MRIAIWHNLPSGGGKRAAYHHVEGLVKRGHVVESWSPRPLGQSYLPLTHLIPEHFLPFESVTPTLPMVRAPLSRLLLPYRAMANTIAAMDQHCESVAREINSRDFDVLLAHPCTVFRVTAIGRHVRIPKVLYVQEPYRDLYEATPRLPWIAMPRTRGKAWAPRKWMPFLHDLVRVQALRLQAREEWQNASVFDRVLVNSYFSRESVLRTYGLDPYVCYLGVSTDIFRPLGRPRDGSVIGVGAIHPTKGIETAIRAIATIPDHKRPPLVWVGNFANEQYSQELLKISQAFGVRFIPRVLVSDQDLVEALNRATAMLYTSHLEPFGLAPLEANACGTPVVAIAEGGVRETIEDGVNGLLVSDRRPEAIGRALERLLDDADLVSTLGERARSRMAERWTWGAAVDRLESHLSEVIRSRHGHGHDRIATCLR